MIKPILHLKMEGNADDSSGNNNHGTVVGASLTEDRFGRPNSAYEFGGTSRITIDNNPIGNSQPITVSTWAFFDNLNDDRTIMGQWGTNQQFVMFYDYSNDSIRIVLRDSAYTQHDVEVVGISSSGIWLNIIFVYYGNYMSIYIDGNNVETSATDGLPIFQSDLDFIIGYDDSHPFMVGKLDDIRIYDVALTPTQVKFLYDSTKRKYK